MDADRTKSDSQFISFQDFPPINQSSGSSQAQFHLDVPNHEAFGNLSNDSTGIGIIEDLQGLPDRDKGTPPRSFWTVEYYQKYFNVNTSDVVERIKWSMILHKTDNYLVTHIRPNPDLYGPFWICVTLIFSIAISGNMANYLQTANSSNYHWKYDFHVVSYAATSIFLYAWLLPLVLWGGLKWTTNTRNTEEELIESYATPGLLEVLCLYGYSLAIYVPVAFLWTIQISWLQWALVIVATILSGGVLLRSLFPVIAGKHRMIYIALILGMHLLFGAGFMLCFFHAGFRTASPHIKEIINVASTLQLPKTLLNETEHAAKTH